MSDIKYLIIIVEVNKYTVALFKIASMFFGNIEDIKYCIIKIINGTMA